MKQHTHHPQVSYMKELGLQFLIIFYEGEPNYAVLVHWIDKTVFY